MFGRVSSQSVRRIRILHDHLQSPHDLHNAGSIETQLVGSKRYASHIVDVWAQPPSLKFIESVPEVERLLVQSKAAPDINTMKEISKAMNPDTVKDLIDAAGVSKVLLSAWYRPGKIAVSNEDVAEYTRAYPDRFVGIGSVDLYKPQEAVKEIEKCVKEYGFKGVRVLPWLWDLPPTTNLYYPVFAKCVELDIPFCTQVGHTGPLCPSEPGRPIPYIDQVALHFPDLKIVCGHIGYPWTQEMIAVAWKHANVFIDTSAHAPKYYPKELLHFADSYGSDKVMFGTNFPQLMFHNCTEQAVKLNLKDENMEKFLWKNANRVFKLGMAN